MRRAAFIILVLFCACHSDPRAVLSGNEVLLYPYCDRKFEWKDIEKRDDELKNSFMKVAQSFLTDEYRVYNLSFDPRIDEFKKALHVVDFNGDGKNDLIFDGDSGGEPKEIAFILNTGKGFKIIFKDFQGVDRIDFESSKVSRLYIKDWGCCAAHMTFNKIYTVSFMNNIPKFKLIYFTGHHQDTYFPKEYFDKPIKFCVLDDHYKIRTKPMIDDTCKTFISGEPLKGDAVGELAKGSNGRAIASQTDNTGRIWWLVEMDVKSKVKSDVFYDDDDKHPASKMGWISSRFVKKTND
ncbi:hypothetical protein KXQ82_09345 [Mucilaginibacter sp. HMF5004]|uniref:hypothetical protein n=1 Tax=Mucilaginibacter rivuli TaxID=2857527 RepID=UPI001C5E9022|nr:hypothetical protein [Mucilaginibacter rivuli]MBW4889921.1 hypothetical protein [Mucilaginibacter rivuli]